jgi:hypothetical protein
VSIRRGERGKGRMQGMDKKGIIEKDKLFT